MTRTFKILVGYSIFLLTSILLGSCAIINKAKEQHQEKLANRFFNEHPEKDAIRCAEHFPPKDSAGPLHLDSVHTANNIDYTGDIEDLLNVIDSLQRDSINRYWIMVLDSSTGEMGSAFRKILLKQQEENAVLKEKIIALQKAYKPCEPEKEYYSANHFTIDSATMAAYAAQKKLNADLQQKLNAANSTNKIRFWMLVAAAAIIILLIVLLYNTIRLKNKLTIPHL